MREALAPNTLISHYRIVSLLGAGGMGEVYLAEDTKLGRKVALKLLSAEFTKNENRVRRFQQEARAASALNHPSILTIHEIGDAGPVHYIATEYIEGQTLRKHLGQHKSTLREVLDVGTQIAGALVEAHAAGIVHRDIKPENIMLRSSGLVKVLDFGLAKLTEKQAPSPDSLGATVAKVDTDFGTVMGTSHYMSPEQARGLTVDARSDIFSLGIVLYEMITGKLPFEGDTTGHVIVSILEKEPLPLTRYAPEAPAELQRIVGKALEKDREERYQVVKDLQLDLKRLKQKLDLDAELKRSDHPEMSGAPGPSGSEPAVVAASPGPATPAQGMPVTYTTSSAEYIVTQIQRHKIGVGLIVAVLIVAAAALWVYFNRTPALTDKDTVLLADFVNTTGDTVFDGTLKQALAVQLEQSPFLNIISDELIRETLRLMGRSSDDRVTKEIGREICQRQGVKALLAGSVSNLGSHYVITLESINAQTGDVITRQQVEAESKEQVLRVLGQTATQLREKLGESLKSIQKFDAPIDQATTSSLEALKAYSIAKEASARSNHQEAIKHGKRAVELDPNFARAYSQLAVSYTNAGGQRELAIQMAQKSFELRDRVSERERLLISSSYYRIVTGETDKSIEALELLKQIYPREQTGRNNLGFDYSSIGQYEKAIEELREAIRLNPNSSVSINNLALAFFRLNRFAEAKEIIEQAQSRKLDTAGNHARLYWIAFINGDAAGMKQQIDWATSRPDSTAHLGWQAQVAEFGGRMRQARGFYGQAPGTAQSRNLAMTEALFGNCQLEKKDATQNPNPMVLALCGDVAQAQALVEKFGKNVVKDTLANAIWSPTLRAAIEVRRNNPVQAIQLLQAARRYGGAGNGVPEYLRGLAYLAQRSGTEAAAEFQYILDHRGLNPGGPLYPLAYLGLARAAALTGDTAKSRKAYQDLLALWKDADPDLPVLLEAQKEYAGLK